MACIGSHIDTVIHSRYGFAPPCQKSRVFISIKELPTLSFHFFVPLQGRMTCVRFLCSNTAGWAISVLCRVGHSAVSFIVLLGSSHFTKSSWYFLASRLKLERWAKTARLQAEPRPFLLPQYLANEKTAAICTACSEANKIVQMGLVLVLRWCPPLVLTTQSDIAMWWPNSTTCPELALIPFTKPCSASWSSHQKQSCRVDYLDLPFKSWFWVSDLCLKKIRCRAGAAEWGLRFRVYPAVFSDPMLVWGWNCFKLTTGVDRFNRPNCYLLLFAKIIKRSDRFFAVFGGHCVKDRSVSGGVVGRSTLKSGMKRLSSYIGRAAAENGLCRPGVSPDRLATPVCPHRYLGLAR